jgi:hypothetical protein
MPIPGSKLLERALKARAIRKTLLTGALSVSLLASPVTASAKDIGAAAARTVKVAVSETATAKVDKLKDIIHTVVGMTDEGATAAHKGRVAKQLGRTAVHESSGLTQTRQISKYVKGKPVYGPARSFWGVEPETATWLTTDYAFDRKNIPIKGKEGEFKSVLRRPKTLANIEKATGLSRDELKNLTQADVTKMLEENVFYAGTMARYKYFTRKGSIPDSLKAQGAYWSSEYQGKGIEANTTNFIQNNKAFNKIIGHHPGWAQKQTERAIDSDFTSGESWTQIRNALKVMGISTGRGVKSIKKGLKTFAGSAYDDLAGAMEKSPVHLQRSAKVTGQSGIFRKAHPSGKKIGIDIGEDALIEAKAAKIGLDPEKFKKFVLFHETLESVSHEPLGMLGRKNIIPFRNLREKVANSIGSFKKGANPYKRGYLKAKGALGWSHADMGVVTGEIRAAEALGMDYTKYANLYRDTGLARKILKQATSGIDLYGRPGWQAIASSGRFIDNYSKIINIGKATSGASAQKNMSKAIASRGVMLPQSRPTAGLVGVMDKNKINHNIMDIKKKTDHLFKQ